MPLDDVELQRRVDCYNRHGGNKTLAAAELGIARTAFNESIAKASRKGLLGFKPVLPGFEISKITTTQDADGEVKSEIVSQRPAEEDNSKPFEVGDGRLIGKVTSHVIDGHVKQEWIRTAPEHQAILTAIRTVVDELKQDLVPVAPTKGPTISNALLLNQYTITDSHFGSLAWEEENRTDSYDLKIAEKLLLDWFSAGIAMAPNAHVGLLAQIGDLLHHDSWDSVTPLHRNVLDADSRLQKIIRVVIRCIRQIIAMMLQKYPHVHVVMAEGNHDPASSAWLRELFCALYENEPRITIDNSPDAYYVYEWGKTALFYHHGHKRKIESVDTVFAGKFREIYGRCLHSYGHTGHLHNDEVKEGNLMKIERHRTLAAPDAYASKGGWIAGRDSKVITYHREFGEVSRITLSPDMVRAAA